AIEIDPQHADAQRGLGDALLAHDEVEQAIEVYRRLIAQCPDHSDAHCHLGVALKRLGQLDEAIACYRCAIVLDPANAIACTNLGNALEAADRYTDAEAAYCRALALAPDNAEAHNALGLTLYRMGRVDDGIAELRRAIALKPDHVNAHTNLGLALLTRGDLAGGWPEYEWRLDMPDADEPERVFRQPRWTGQDLGGKSLLVHFEQGLGDTLQFVRYVPVLARRGIGASLACQPELRRLLAKMPGARGVITTGDKLPRFDFRCSLMSLPLRLGTDLDSIPSEVPYLHADPALAQAWRERLSSPAFKVGLAWAGKPSYRADRRRSIPLAAFAPLAAVAGVEFHSLQKGSGAEQARNPPPGLALIDHAGELSDFADTAALVAHLDLVISVDSAVAHLAGAMGKPVWLLCRYESEWRWMHGREDSPWYPTMRIFRQFLPGNWDDVMARVARVLPLARGGDSAALPPKPMPPARPVQAARLETFAASRTPQPNAASFNELRRCRHGLMLFNVNDQYVGRSLLEYGEFSEYETELFRQLLRPGDCVVEAGANIGAHTLFLAQAVGRAGTVHAFEPQRIVFQTLCANLALNELTNVRAYHAALGEARGTIAVPEPDPRRNTNFGGLSLGRTGNAGQCAMQTIDELRLTGCRLIKADVEGMEAEVLSGARATVEALRPILYVENDRRDRSARLIGLIRGFGYRMWWHLPPLYHPANFAANSVNVFGNIVSINLLCLPREMDLVVPLREVGGDDDWWRTPA
ncbi:MAG TPA: FkbM family methyltransferase, partial [Burkholderiales bacterium]|nr:FkbM family methyltransferase [Burkholderiales bacterium]